MILLIPLLCLGKVRSPKPKEPSLLVDRNKLAPPRRRMIMIPCVDDEGT